MARKLLILGGSSEASRLAEAVAARGIEATFSYAGRVAALKPQPIPWRVGGFGGVEGLVDYLRAEGISHLIDATHPFAEQMSRNAVAASAQAGVPLLAYSRPPWAESPGDDWRHVPDIAGAVLALPSPPQRVMLALGRLNLPAFAAQPQHHYLLRLVEELDAPPPFPHYSAVISRGPFTVEGDTALFRDHEIDLVVCKNAGGSAAEAKLHAARALGIPVIMIARPALPPRKEVTSLEAVFDWLYHSAADLGV